MSSIKDRLLPSLLDRLSGVKPGKMELTRDEFKTHLKRDMEWLFKTVSLASIEGLDAPDRTPPSQREYWRESVLNFGVQDFAGHTASSIKHADPAVEKRLRLAVEHFEPRILPSTLKIKLRTSDQCGPNAMSFDIQCAVRMQPVPWPQHWQTEVDLETGAVEIKSAAAEPLKPRA